MEKKIMSPSTKGLLIGLALILISLAIILTKQESNKSLGFISIAVALGGIIWACQTYSSQMDGNVTFGNIFSHGFKTSALVAALVSLWVALSLGLLFPETLDRAMEAQRLELIKKQMSDEDIENAMNVGKKLALPMGVIFSVIMYLIIGAIGALIGASIAKKNPNPVFPEQLGN
jgi:hypothetical protein